MAHFIKVWKPLEPEKYFNEHYQSRAGISMYY